MITFLVALFVRLMTETVGRWSENCYLTGQPLLAALGAAVTTLVAIPLSRLLIADGDNSIAAAIVLAVAVTTYRGAESLRRKQAEQ